MINVKSDIDKLLNVRLTGDASPFRTAVRNVVAACKNSPVALASYCREGLIPALATALPQVASSPQLGTCVLDVALCVSQQLLVEPKEGSPAGGTRSRKADDKANHTFAVGESVMARRLDNEFCEGTVLDRLEDGQYVVVWNDEEAAAKLSAGELMPFGSGGGLAGERRQRVAPAFILNNFLMRTAIPSNDLSRVQARPPARPTDARPPVCSRWLPFVPDGPTCSPLVPVGPRWHS